MSPCKIPSHLIKRAENMLPVMLALLVLLSPEAQAQQPASPATKVTQPSHQSDNNSDGEKDAQDPNASTAAENDSAARTSGQTTAVGNRFIRFFRKTTIEGFIDTYYSYNFNRPASQTNLLRSFDIHERRFSFNAGDIAFDKPSTADSRIGFRLDLFFGPAADYLGSSEPGNIRFYKNIHQAYISYLAPVGAGLHLDAGKFAPWAGAEVDNAKENWNYSRSLLYSLAQPSFHTGVRASYDVNKKVSLLAAFVNGWSKIEENNSGKTFGLSLALKPLKHLSLTQSYTVGPEQPGDNQHRRHLLDTIISYDFNERVRVLANYDYGLERLKEGGSARWQGVAAYLRYAFTERIAFSPRFEIYADYDGHTSGTAQRLKELTLTGEYKFNKYLLTRLEYRRDWSNQPVFERTNPIDFARTQATLLGGMIWSFSTRDEKTNDSGSAGTGAPPAQTNKPVIPQVSPRSQVSAPQPVRGAVSIGNIKTTDSLPEP